MNAWLNGLQGANALLLGILLGGASATGPVKIMFPMIATLGDLRAAQAVADQVRAELGVPPVEIAIMVAGIIAAQLRGLPLAECARLATAAFAGSAADRKSRTALFRRANGHHVAKPCYRSLP